MFTLLMRLEGHMQSYGENSLFQIRETNSEPTKSAVIGILCAAMGIDRRNITEIEKLSRLRMGVRVDCEGDLEKDFQTAGAGKVNGVDKYYIIKAKGVYSENASVTEKYFLSQASFLVGFESEDYSLLKQCHESLRNPVWHLFLGRKSFVPSSPIYLPDGLRGGFLENVLKEYPYIPWGIEEQNYEQLRMVIEGKGPNMRNDIPISFEIGKREFGSRNVGTIYMRKDGV